MAALHGRGDAGGWNNRLRRWSCVGRMAVSKDAAQETVAMAAALSVCCGHTAAYGCAEGLVLGVLVGVLLAVLELLLEGPGLLLVGKRQASQAVLELEGVEEDAVLVVGKGVIDLLVPDDAAGLGLPVSVWGMWVGRAGAAYRNVDHLQPEGVAHEVVGEDDGALQAGVGPSVRVGIGNV
jgi:hypothetical protein